MGTLLWLLIIYPAIAAALLLAIRSQGARGAFVCFSAGLTAICSIAFAALYAAAGEQGVWFEFESHAADLVMVAADVVISVTIIVMAIKGSRPIIAALAGIQLAFLAFYEIAVAPGVSVERAFYADTLTVIMVLVIGIIGTGITVYAIGYMRDFQEHAGEGAPDRRPKFFAVMYIFLTGMYLIVFSNNLAWLFCGWEITTICSFLLIGYTKTEEATNNAFRQIWMNLLGGMAFAVANIVCGMAGIGELTTLVALGSASTGPIITLAVTLLGFASVTKAAQMPFHTWLLGAMVAPTPTSALLHSSTMVKAGCFLLIRLAPTYGVNVPGVMLMLVGGFTFMFASMMAITQSNAKRVLAYSTIANLGLIVACAGVGSAMAVWAAIFLLIFHAAAKSLLFLCVGTAEHHIGSRNIEDMDELFSRMPRLSRFMVIGILVMFIAPFGMLVSKWAAFESFISSGNVALVLMLVFGSAATFFFWAKWLGKITASATSGAPVEEGVHPSEWGSITLMAALALACTFLFPVISALVVEPYIGITTGISMNNLWLLSLLAVFVIAVLIGTVGRKSSRPRLPVYLAGGTVDEGERMFYGSFLKPVQATQRNWYMTSAFPEAKMCLIGQVACAVMLCAGVVAAVALVFMAGGAV